MKSFEVRDGHRISAIWGQMIFGWAMNNSAILLGALKKDYFVRSLKISS